MESITRKEYLEKQYFLFENELKEIPLSERDPTNLEINVILEL